MNKTDRILKDSTFYTVSTLVAQFVGIITSIATRRLLTPDMMGIWATFLVVLNYALFAHMGIFTAIEVKIPYLRGKGDTEELEAMRSTAFTFGLIISIVMAVIMFVSSFFFVRTCEAYVVLGIRVTALIIAATLFYNLYIVMLRADKDFTLLSKAVMFNSVAMLVFVTGFTYLWGLKGIYFATLLATAASWLYIMHQTKYRLRFGLDGARIAGLVKVGLPILLVGVAYTFLISIDKIMIIKMIGPTELGFYSIAILAFTYTNTFPKLFGIVIFPSMQEAFGRTDSKEHILGYVREPAIIMSYIFPALLAAAYFAIPVLVHYVLPKYVMGIDSMKILLAGCFFISLAPLAQNFAISVGRQAVLIPMTAAALFLGMGFDWWMIKAGYGINGVALGTSAAYFAYFAALFWYALRHSGKGSEITGFLFKVSLPLAYSAVIMMLLERFLPIKNVMLAAVVWGVIFYAAYMPMLFYVEKKTKVISRLFNNIFRKQLLDEKELAAEKVTVEEGVEV